VIEDWDNAVLEKLENLVRELETFEEEIARINRFQESKSLFEFS
jgi:hypothetical protein